MYLSKTKLVFLVCILFCFVTASAQENYMEARGKKKKIALFIYFADIILKKFFVLKLIYAFVFWVILHKAGYFLSWFINYLKDQKSHHHDHHEYYEPHHHYEYGGHGPYRKESHGIY